MISVIIPVYNAEATLAATLASVRKQTWRGEFELIIVDDGSADGSLQVIQTFQRDNPLMKITVVEQPNNGVSAARNAGLRLAKGDYIALLDADDVWFPEKTEKQMQVHMKMPHVDFLACRSVNQVLRWPYRAGSDGLAEITFRKLMLRNEAPTPTVIFKRKILENTGFFDPDQRFGEDINYWLRISHKNRMYILDEALVVTGDGKRSFGVSGLSANLREMEKGFQKNLDEMLHSERITMPEYVSYLVYNKLKYLFRLLRDQILKLQGK